MSKKPTTVEHENPPRRARFGYSTNARYPGLAKLTTAKARHNRWHATRKNVSIKCDWCKRLGTSRAPNRSGKSRGPAKLSPLKMQEMA
jgi:hypothetical protein